MKSEGITTDQIVAEIARLAARRPESDGGMTAEEIRSIAGVGIAKGRNLIRAACSEGTLECRRAPRPNILGEMQRVAVYFPAKKPAAKK